MARKTEIVGAGGIVLTPVLLGAADLLRMSAEGVDEVGGVATTWGVAEATAQLAAIDAHRGTFELASWLAYAGVLASIPAAVALWRLAAARSRRWAWTGLLLAVLGVIGEVVHLTGYYGLLQLLSAQPDRQSAAELGLAFDVVPFNVALFVPFLLGALAWLPQAVALRRARIVPLWAALTVCLGTVLFLGVGSQPWSTTVWAGALVVGLAPAARALLRAEPAVHAPVTGQHVPA
ncbi:hypothetical protein SAMN05660464_3382 [Geodermatophilus dictyosporus]|uniref:DUF4386 family protein n=1 Tax=Geodermatophilus dictyosporus TaxID=1523247 RepID=A0A1I5QY97_9ACTN|nr:DUF4386 family protein [Geodermatophilus dictyosporus]SFP51284.1 hypothetical protein SAMN05660464_3382 [Geodermatophilus dictyosporus]